MLSCRSAPGSPGTWIARPRCAPPPSGGPDSVFRPGRPVSPLLFAGCVPGSREPPLPGDRLDSRIPCPTTDAEAAHQHCRDAPQLRFPKSAPRAWCRGRWLRPPPRSAARRSRQAGRFACCLPCRGPWGCGPLNPPNRTPPWRSPQTATPIHAAQFLALLDQHGPDAFQHTKLHPALEGSVYRAFVPQFPRETVPLAAAAHPSRIRLG